MGKVLSLVNHKGGVGKTVLSLNLAEAFSRKGLKVLLVDADPHANATRALLGGGLIVESSCLMDAVFHEGSDVSPFVRMTNTEGVSLIPGSLRLMEIHGHLSQVAAAQRIFVKKMQYLRGFFDFIIVDTPSNLGLMSEIFLMASDWYFVPVQGGDAYGVSSLADLGVFLNRISVANRGLRFGGAIINRYHRRFRAHRCVADAVNDLFQGRVLETKIPGAAAIGCGTVGIRTVVEGMENASQRAFIELAEEIQLLIDQEKGEKQCRW